MSKESATRKSGGASSLSASDRRESLAESTNPFHIARSSNQSTPKLKTENSMRSIRDFEREIENTNNAMQRAIAEKRNAISKNDVAVMKSMKKPTLQARELSELMCKVFGVQPYYVK